MRVEACLLLMLNSMVVGFRRGPHHPHGQSPVERDHHHYKPKNSKTITGDEQLLHDTKHIEEDSGVLSVEALSKMTPEELEFYYFSAHDFDKNSMLDGLEMLKSVYHTTEHEDDDPDADSSIEPEANEFDSYVALIDQTIASDDTDGDGFISYAEYRAARVKNSPERTSGILATTKQ